MSLIEVQSTTGAIFPGNAHPTLNNPKYAKMLADILDLDLRLDRVPVIQVTVFIDNTPLGSGGIGSDTTGTGSSSFPVFSINRAIQFSGKMSGVATTLSLANTGIPYTMSGVYPNMNFINITGVISTGTPRNITNVVASNFTSGVVIDVDGPTLVADELENRLLSLTNILANNRQLIVRRNDATVAGVTRLYCIMSRMDNVTLNDSQTGVTTTGDVALQTLPEIVFSGTVEFESSFQFNFRNVKCTGATSDIFCNSTDKVEWRYCEIYVRSVTAGTGGGAFITASSAALFGTTAGGVFQGRNGGNFRLAYGSVVTNLNSLANSNNYLNIQEDSKMVWEGITFFRGIATNGIRMDGANSFVLNTNGANNFVFFDNDTGTPTCTSAFKINQQGFVAGVVYGLPLCQGKVNNLFYVYATLGADVTCNANSTIATTHATITTNTVTTDGTNPSAHSPDGTIIRNASPSSSSDWFNVLETATSPLTPDLKTYGKIFINTLTGARVINLPLSTLYQAGASITIVDYKKNCTLNNITVNAAVGDTVDQLAFTTMAVNGMALVFTLSGTNWAIA